MTTIAHTIPKRPGLVRRLHDLWTQAKTAHQHRREAMQMRETLSMISDAGLRDLGFDRSEIDSLVAETRMPARQRRPRVGPL